MASLNRKMLSLNRFVNVAPLDVFVGDSGSGGEIGLVPAPSAGDTAAGKFLKASGSWTTPPTLVGDSGSGGTKGYAPAPSAGDAAAGKFLKADATWAVPTASISDGDKGDIIVSGSGTVWKYDLGKLWAFSNNLFGYR